MCKCAEIILIVFIHLLLSCSSYNLIYPVLDIISSVISNQIFLYLYKSIIGGALLLQAEIKPYEPDAGNADVGKCS